MSSVRRNATDPAHPVVIPGFDACKGMTKRELIAAHILANFDKTGGRGIIAKETGVTMARNAIQLTDQLLIELDKRPFL